MNLNSLIARVALKALAPKARAFEDATKNPIEAQEKVLLEYLNRNKDTEYGRKHKFAEIKSIKDYQRLVPTSDCDTIKPYVERMKNGGENILTSDKVIFYGLTSGTTARQKFIPVTEYSRAKKAEVAELWAYYISRDHPKVLDGNILAIISPEVEGRTGSGIPYGAESGHGYKNLPEVIKKLYAIPYEIFEISDYEARYYSILRIGIESNITTIATLNPNTLALLCQKIKKYQDSIISDIENGTLGGGFNISPELRKAIEKDLKPNPERARVLRSIISEKGELSPKYFWRDLQIIECWKGGTVKLYLKELPQYFGDTPVRDFGCLSTEARSSIPMSDEGAGGALAINTNFYEFVPKEDMGKKAKRFLLADQLEKDGEYFLVVTTPGGLYRYDIDDIVKVDGFFNSTPMIEFVQKGLSAFSIVGEKLYESQVIEAINKASDRIKVLIEFFSATVQRGISPRYIFLVEFDGSPSEHEKKGLLKAIEEELCSVNQEYEFVRKSQLLAPPVMKIVKKGEFEKYRVKKLAEGAHDGQFKVPELMPDPDFQDNFEVEEDICID